MPASLSLIRAAQWAVNVLAPRGEPVPDLSAMEPDVMQAFVQRAEQIGGRTRARRTDLFPSALPSGERESGDTVIAQTMRWFLDHCAQQSVDDPHRGTVRKRDLMDVYHHYSTRKSPSRSSYANNLGPYSHGAGPLITSFVLKEPQLRKDGKPRTRAIKRWVPNGTDQFGYRVWASEPTGEREEIVRQTDMVRWIGPTIEQWLRSLIPSDLDNALTLMERRLLAADTESPPLTPVTKRRDHGARKVRADESPPLVYALDDRGIAERWIERIRTEIARRNA